MSGKGAGLCEGRENERERREKVGAGKGNRKRMGIG